MSSTCLRFFPSDHACVVRDAGHTSTCELSLGSADSVVNGEVDLTIEELQNINDLLSTINRVANSHSKSIGGADVYGDNLTTMFAWMSRAADLLVSIDQLSPRFSDDTIRKLPTNVVADSPTNCSVRRRRDH